MNVLNYQVEFFSCWHCGSGLGGGDDADAIPLLDHDGLPFIPGRTLKGLVREAAELLYADESGDFIIRVFGDEGSEQGVASWSNACMADEQRQAILQQKLAGALRTARYFVSLDEKGQAKEGCLRRAEFVVPMTLYGSIGYLSPEDGKLLKDCLGFIKQMGTHRSRGFGRCQFTVSEERQAGQDRQTPPPDIADVVTFSCRFESEVVLNSSAATEDNHESLDYIPGANFLGMAARSLYGKLDGEEFAVFHSGHVRFNDGRPLIGNKASFVCPANWFVYKGEGIGSGARLFPFQQATPEDLQLKPIKQQRGGYCLLEDDGALRAAPALSKSFSLKSGYDREKRGSKEGILFGYSALPAESQWYFTVTFSPRISQDTRRRVVGALLGPQRLGRSRQAQYGAVHIALLTLPPLAPAPQPAEAGKFYYLYAASHLAFRDERGLETIQPDAQQLGFPPDAKLRPDKSWLRTHRYAPWNGKRASRDADRLCISRGSVLCVESTRPPDAQKLAAGIGLFRAEGFGNVWVNPAFLWAENIAAQAPAERPAGTAAVDKNDRLLGYLRQRQAVRRANQLVTQAIDDFSRQVRSSRVTPSQWGAVRARATTCRTYAELKLLLFEKEEKVTAGPVDYIDQIKSNRASRDHHPGFLVHGRVANAWKGNGMIDKLKDAMDAFYAQPELASLGLDQDSWTLLFVERLCAEMAKKTAKAKKRQTGREG
ncbi:MAG: hypothetical protein GX945_00180 [Lentisphaerae bacterium]|nr:hypothetical protein [Lentisphaerota bacterium]